MYFVLIGTVIIIVFIVYIYKKDVDDEEKEEFEDSVKNELVQPEKSKEIILYFNTDLVKISFYSLDLFKYYGAKNIYKKIVVEKLYIDEPFHTSLVKLLQIFDKTQSWIKSKNTKEIRLKIRKKNGNFEEGTSFKVYSISEIIVDFLDNILEYFNRNLYSKEDQKNIILAALVWKIDLVEELKYIWIENLSDTGLREYLGKKILKHQDVNYDVFRILRMIENKHVNVQFVFKVYDNTLCSQQEYPYVSKGKEEYKKFNIDNLPNKNMKQLMSIDDVSVY